MWSFCACLFLRPNSDLQMCTTVVGASILTAWPNSDALIIAGFFLAACGYVTSVVWTWANEVNTFLDTSIHRSSRSDQ